jgi:hypothetical protein
MKNKNLYKIQKETVDAWHKEIPPMTKWDNFLYYWGRIKNHLKWPRRLIERIYQKKKYGCTNIETWNLDTTMAQFILPRLKRYKTLSNGYPNGLTEKKWNQILDKMIYSMEFYANERQFEDKGPDWKRVNEGTELIGKYFGNLWW